MRSATKKSSSLSDARNLTKRVCTGMRKIVKDLTALRNATEDIRSKLDKTPDVKAADRMYDFYNEIAHLESEIAEVYPYFKDMYEELGGTDAILDMN